MSRKCSCHTHLEPELCDVEDGYGQVSAYSVVCPSCLQSTRVNEDEGVVWKAWEKGDVR